MKLKDSTILLTGGTLGIGKATAKLLIASGAKVAITGRDKDRTETAANEIGAFAITADVAKPEDIERTYSEFLAEFDRLDCLINNAGIGTFNMLENTTREDFESVFSVNVFGAAAMASRAVPLFKDQNYGHIINIGSTAALKGFKGGTVYSASKFALRSMTECWQAELRPENIRVMLINPSEVPTAFSTTNRVERPNESKKLTSIEIAHAIKSALEMDNRGMIPELTVWASNPW